MNTVIFWTSLSLLLYASVGYLGLLWIWANVSRQTINSADNFNPKATVLITAFNEEECIATSIQSILDSSYPDDKLKIVIVSDSSSDHTDEIVSKFNPERVRLVRTPIRSGKVTAQKLGLSYAEDEIVIIADASGVFLPNTVERLIRHFRDPHVGLVVGSKRIKRTGTIVAEGEGIYWKYDALLRHLESRTGSSCVGAEGGLTAVRRHLFPCNIPSDIAEDYAMGCELFIQGFQSHYDPTAAIYEIPSDGIQAEFKRKVRVIVKGMRTFFRYRALLHPLRGLSYPLQTISHKLLRWIGPFLLIALFISSAYGTHSIEKIMFCAQIGFYAMAFIGYMFRASRSRLTSVPLYFTTVNLAALVAWALIFKKYSIWDPTHREQPSWATAQSALLKERL